MDKIKIFSVKETLIPLFNYFELKYGDLAIINKVQSFLNELVLKKNKNDFNNFLKFSQPFDFFQTQNLISIIGFEKTIEKSTVNTNGEKVIWESKLAKFNNSLARFCKSILSLTRDYDEIIKYYLTYMDLIYYVGMSTNGKKTIADIYDLRGIDFFLSYSFYNKNEKNLIQKSFFRYAELTQKCLEFNGRNEEADFISNELKKRRKGLIKIVEEFSRAEPDKSFENLRLFSERFWVEYLSKTVFKTLNAESRKELIDSLINEQLIKKGILTNPNQVALTFCKVIERELNNSIFHPYKNQFGKCNIIKPSSEISKISRKKIEKRLFTVETAKKCVERNHSLTFGQIIFLMRFWNDPILNDYSDLFKLIKKENHSFDKVSDSIQELLSIMEIKNNELTLVDIRNSSAHPTLDKDIDWDEYVRWIKLMLGKPPKEILKRIVIDTRI